MGKAWNGARGLGGRGGGLGRAAATALCALLAACAGGPPQAAAVDTRPTPITVGGGTRVAVALKSFKELRDQNVVKQALDYSCGAAALATLLTYGLGDRTSEREVVAEILKTLDQDEERLRQKEGFSLLDMQRVAERRGYKAQGFRIAPESLDELRGPVIVFVRPRGYEHFAVLRGVRGDRVYLADPSLGNVRRAGYDFLDMWLGDDGRGIIFVVEPEDAGRIGESRLAVGASGLPRPELMSARQLLEVGRTGPPAAGVLR